MIMFRFLILSFLFLAALTQNAFAVGLPSIRHWENAWWGGGGTFPLITPDLETPNKVYAVSDVAGFFTSSDKGDNWTYSNSGTTTIIDTTFQQSEYNPDIMWILGRRLVKSINRGQTWTNVASFVGIRGQRTIAIDRNNPNIVYVAISDGTIRKTTDGGTNWTTFATPFSVGELPTFLYINPTSTYLIVGSFTSGMMRYNLSTGSSSAITLSGTNALYNWDYTTYRIGSTEHFCTGGGLHISCTVDNGDNWTNTADATADTSFFVARVATRTLANTQIRMIAYGRRTSTPYGTNLIMVSNDSGATWTDSFANITIDLVNNPSNTWNNYGSVGNVVSVSADPFNEDVFYITTDWRIWRSDDGGQNWLEKIKGAQNTVISDVTVSPNGKIFACGMDVGCYSSTNNGDTWIAAIPHVSNGDPQGVAIAGPYWRVITTGTLSQWNAGTGHVIVTASPWSMGVNVVWRSTDNGVTWTLVTSGLPTTVLNGSGTINTAAWGTGYARALAKSPTDENILYLCMDGFSATENGGVFRSSDNGVTWARTTQPTGWKCYNGLSVDPTDVTGNTLSFTEWFYTFPNIPHTYKSINGGTSWTTTGTSNGTYELAYNSVGNAVRAGLGSFPSVDYSTNGDSWSLMHNLNNTSNVADGLVFDPSDNNRLFVGVNDGTSVGPGTGSGLTGGSVYMTADALSFSAATWIDLTADFPSPAGVQALAINPTAGDDGYLFAAVDGAGVFRMNLADTAPTTISNLTIGE